jgi:hypothetical protein
MDDFQGTRDVVLQPGDAGVPVRFEVTVCSDADANDGALPYGESVGSVVVSAHKEDGTDATSALINGTPSTSGNTIIVVMDYPGSTGIFHLKFIVTATPTSTLDREFDFKRVRCFDR